MGQNQIETKSVSLIFLDFDLEYEVFERVFANFIKYVAHKTIEEIKYKDLTRLIDEALPEDRELYPLTKNQIIIGFANNYLPQLKPLANDIQNEMGTSINPEIEDI